MNEQSGETQQGQTPRPNRRPSRPRRRGGQRRPPRENRNREETPSTLPVRETDEPQTATPDVLEQKPVESTVESSPVSETAKSVSESAPAAQEQRSRQQFSQPRQQQSGRSQLQHRHDPQQRQAGSPLIRAVAQVEDIILSLKESLRELEEVLEILDDAQRQQIGDEKEIESLRRALSVLQRERQSAPSQERREQPRRFEQRRRQENRNRPEPQQPAPAESPAMDEAPEEPSE